MDLKESQVKGAMLIAHKIHEGKHQYEVENVIKYKKGGGKNAFARRGDKLVQINSMSLDDVTPEELAQILTEESPKLSVLRLKDHPKEPVHSEEVFCAVSKEYTLLRFHMQMRRKEDPEGSEVGQEAGSRENEEIKEGGSKADMKENSEGGDLVIVSMKKTSFCVVRGRGCTDTGGTVNDVVLLAQSSKVTLVSRGGESFKVEKSQNVTIEHVATRYYLNNLCSQNLISVSPNPDRITIYCYKTNGMDFRGMPVALNFTESNCFLKCCMKDQNVLLQVEACDKSNLREISKSDENALAFIFYMKADKSKQRTFESALYKDWFIQVMDDTSMVEMAPLNAGPEEYSFLFVFQK